MSSLQIQEHVPLAPFTTIGVGGSARFFARITAESTLAEAVTFAQEHRLPLFPLGGGSNLLVHDEGFPGLVLHMDLQSPATIVPQEHAVEYTVASGVPWDRFVLETCQAGLSGIECLAGIPGSTGGTPVQNVGAYGQEVSQTIVRVRAFDRPRAVFQELSNAECRFSYRSSLFNTFAPSRYLVTAVTFSLPKALRPSLRYAELARHFTGKSPSPLEVYTVVRAIRQGKGMLRSPNDPNDPDSRSVGSFFKNPIILEEQFTTMARQINRNVNRSIDSIPHWPAPDAGDGAGKVKLAAAWLVEQAGFPRGFALGRAGISSRHSLALINRGEATFADIARLRDLIRSGVAGRFGIALDQEPVELGPHSIAALTV